MDSESILDLVDDGGGVLLAVDTNASDELRGLLGDFGLDLEKGSQVSKVLAAMASARACSWHGRQQMCQAACMSALLTIPDRHTRRSHVMRGELQWRSSKAGCSAIPCRQRAQVADFLRSNPVRGQSRGSVVTSADYGAVSALFGGSAPKA